MLFSNERTAQRYHTSLTNQCTLFGQGSIMCHNSLISSAKNKSHSFTDSCLKTARLKSGAGLFLVHIIFITSWGKKCTPCTDLSLFLTKAIHVLSSRYTKHGLQAEENRALHKYKKNIAMTDCLVILYPARRQSVIAMFFLYLW